MSHPEEIKPCPICTGVGITRRKWKTLIPTWECLCLRCGFEMDLAQWNYMPRREEFYAELMGLAEIIEKAYGGRIFVVSDVVKKLADKYAPEDGG